MYEYDLNRDHGIERDTLDRTWWNVLMFIDVCTTLRLQAIPLQHTDRIE